MTKSEMYARRDGIAIERGACRGGYGNVYLIPCASCGEIVRRKVYDSDRMYFCEYCKMKIDRKKKARQQYEMDKIMTKGEQRFEKAFERVLDQVDNPLPYMAAANIAEKRSEYYDSIPEAMAAIELIKLGYRVIPQQKVGRYRVDFCLPDEKVVLEIDGGLYHRDKFGGDREATIQLSLGLDWEIIHVPADEISRNITKLKSAIDTILQHRGKK